MLSLPSVRFTTSCSQPEDFVKTSKDLDDAVHGLSVHLPGDLAHLIEVSDYVLASHENQRLLIVEVG